jgi:hypothetical protein
MTAKLLALNSLPTLMADAVVKGVQKRKWVGI